MGTLFTLLTVVALNVNARAQTPTLDEWLDQHYAHCSEMLTKAVSPPGGAAGSVMASPSKENPEYFRHWVRDAALSIKVLLIELDRAIANDDRHSGLEVVRKILDFVDFSRQLQLTPNRSGNAATGGLGEPLFEITGAAFNKGWGRPQNDGPALRAITLIELAPRLEKMGFSDIISRKLYRAEMPAHTVIKADLEYVSYHWKEMSVDLWEEVRGHHFYTRLTQWKALEMGAKFARMHGDSGAADWYAQQAQSIAESLAAFWNPEKRILRVTLEPTGGDKGKISELDIAILLAVLHTDPQAGLYPVDHPHVISTVEALESAFGRAYFINQRRTDWDGAEMEPGTGRYTEDTYDGYTIDAKGNPWFLSTHAMAEYYFQFAKKILRQQTIELTPENLSFYSNFLDKNAPLRVGQKIDAQDPRFQSIVAGFREKGLRFLRRSRFHTAKDGSQSEQFNRDTGYMQGAEHLTWSYASFIEAVKALKELDSIAKEGTNP